MEAGADKTESQLAEGKHTFLKKVDENFPAIILIKNASHWRDTLIGVSRQFYSPLASCIATQWYSAIAE